MPGIVKSELTLCIASLQHIYEVQKRFRKTSIVCGANSSSESMPIKMLQYLLTPSPLLNGMASPTSYNNYVYREICYISTPEIFENLRRI